MDELNDPNMVCKEEFVEKNESIREPSSFYESKRRRLRTTLHYLWQVVMLKMEILSVKAKNQISELRFLIRTIYGHKM